MPPRRGRPKKGEAPTDTEPSPFAGWTEDVLGEMVAAAFAGLQVTTGRDHWARSAKECAPIAKPLSNMLGKLPRETLAKLEKHSDQIALLGGCIAVTWPSLVHELEYYRALKAKKLAPPAGGAATLPGAEQRNPTQGFDYSGLGTGGAGEAAAGAGPDRAAPPPAGTDLSGLVPR